MSLRNALAAANIPEPPANKHPQNGFLRYGKNNRYWLKQEDDVTLFGDWATGETHHYFEDSGRPFNAEQASANKLRLAGLKKAQEAEQQEIHGRLAARAMSIWNQLSETGTSPYLEKKQVEAFGVRFRKQAIVIPVCDTEGKIWSLQYINHDGKKRFLAGGRKRGCFHALGKIGNKIYIAEGYATAASTHMATGLPVVVAFDAGNLEYVTAVLKRKYPALQITIAADNDCWKPEQGNSGKEKAEAVAQRFNCNVVLPEFSDAAKKQEPTDWNDLHVLEGLAAVKAQLLQKIPVPTDEETLAWLATLPPLQYDKEREAIAKKLGVRVATLDKEIEKARGGGEDTNGQGRILFLPKPEAWHEAVGGAEVLDELVTAIRRYVVMPPHTAITTALWIIHTYIFDIFTVTPRLTISSPEKGCGKTTLLDVIYHLVPRPLLTANVTVSVVFRIIEKVCPTMLIDEADASTKDNEELRGILNSGHRKGGTAIRTIGENHEPRAFSTHSPLVIALIGRLPDTLEDRSIPIRLCRRKPDEPITQFRADRTDDLNMVARKAARWAQDNRLSLTDADPVVPNGIYNRAADNWRVLLAIADAAGGKWPKHARNAAIALCADENAKMPSLQAQLLGDIRSIFDERRADKLASAELADALAGIEERPWGEWKGKPITTNGLARLLQPFGIRPDNIKIEGRVPKGYWRKQFEDAWSRYLLDDTSLVTATPLPAADSLDYSDIPYPLPTSKVAV